MMQTQNSSLSSTVLHLTINADDVLTCQSCLFLLLCLLNLKPPSAPPTLVKFRCHQRRKWNVVARRSPNLPCSLASLTPEGVWTLSIHPCLSPLPNLSLCQLRPDWVRSGLLSAFVSSLEVRETREHGEWRETDGWCFREERNPMCLECSSWLV